MSEADASIVLMPEQAPALLDAEFEQAHIQEYDGAQNHSVSEISADQYTNASTVPEMPASHDSINPQTLTTAGLVKTCKYFAGIADRDPALAERMAESAIQAKKHEADMQRQGLDAAAIKSEKWAAMRKRHQQKVTAAQSPSAAEKLEPGQTISTQIEAEPAELPLVVEAAPLPLPVLNKNIPLPVVRKITEDHRPPKPTGAPPAIIPVSVIKTAPPVTVAAIEVTPPLEVIAAADPKPSTPLTFETQTTIDMMIEPATLPAATAVIEATVPVTLPEPPPFTGQPSFNDPADAAALAPPVIATEYTPAAAHETTTRATTTKEPTAWDVVLQKEPAELCNDFGQALHAQVAVEQPHEVTAEPEPVPSIVVTVVEQLDSITDDTKETVAPLLHDIVMSVQIVEALHIDSAAPEIIEAMVVQLEEEVASLFEALGIAYDTESITQFVGVLLRPTFQPVHHHHRAMIDIERQGTHEVKRRFAQIVSNSLADVEHEAERMIGGLMLQHISAPRAGLLTV